MARAHHRIEEWQATVRVQSLRCMAWASPETHERAVKEFSGLAWASELARALMVRRITAADEPTNHLDLDAVLWLENGRAVSAPC